MIQNITMPQLGESVTEGTLERWLVKPGDVVNKYDPLAEVNTDKVNAEVPSSYKGVIKELIAKEGETLPVGALVCTIEVAGQENLPLPPKKQKSNVSNAILNAGLQRKEEMIAVTPPRDLRPPKIDGLRYSPAVLTLAAKFSIDLAQVKGTGNEGRITRKDVQAVIDSGHLPLKMQKPQVESQSISVQTEATREPSVIADRMMPGDIEIPVTPVRRAIAKNMLRSTHEIPHAWMMIEVDVTDLVHYRDAMKDEFKKREGFNVTYFAFFVKAVAQALKEFPMMNSVWQGDKIIQKKDVNLSIAVATDDALFVPVISQVDDKSIKGIAKDIHELSNLVRKGQLKQEHMQGGTFTVNNTGSFGSVQSMGIINYPQAAILQVEKIVKKPVIVQGDMIAPRHMVNLCLSLDHRILDGLICGNFLARVKEILENTNKQTMSVY